MKRGGYQIVDFGDIAITPDDDPVTISGAYESIANCHRKPTVVSGINISDTHCNDVYVDFLLDGSDNYVGTLYDLTLTITPEDAVSLATPDDGGGE